MLDRAARQSEPVFTMDRSRSSGTREAPDARRVMIVDDDIDSAELIALLLERDGHQTSVAHHARAAVELAVQFRPDVAFLDIGLPGMNGLELAQALRSLPELSACRLVAVSGYDTVGAADTGRAFDAYFTKPVNLEAVADYVRHSTQRSASEQRSTAE